MTKIDFGKGSKKRRFAAKKAVETKKKKALAETRKNAAIKATHTRKTKTFGHSEENQKTKYAAMLGYSKKISKKIPTCNCCGVSELDFLNIDHIKGKKEMMRDTYLLKIGYNSKRSGKGLNRWLINNNFPRGFQVLCFNCNVAKELYGKCPHKRK